jgi:AcrR family transcriptional regulator
MTVEERRARDRAARRRMITDTARALAEREGWDAVTTRRLSAEIEYSQPVIYQHFAAMEDIAEEVALEGFAELAEALGRARAGAAPGAEVGDAAGAYLRFAADNPALYDAMFSRATRLRFAAEDTPAPLRNAFAELCASVATLAAAPDVATMTEVVWAALHGLATLALNGRLRPDHAADRLAVLISRFRPADSGGAA